MADCEVHRQYPRELRELVILDDAGQYDNQAGDGWRLVSIPSRFRSLGEKRNACAALASTNVDGFLVADDDDIYLPHWFRTQAEALSRAEWLHPGLVLVEHNDGLRACDTGGLYHGGWAFRREAFYRVRGYGPRNNGEDQELADRFMAPHIASHATARKRFCEGGKGCGCRFASQRDSDICRFQRRGNGTSQSRTHGPTHEPLTAGGQGVTQDTKGNILLIPASV